MREMFHFEQLNFGDFPNKYSSSNDFGSEEVGGNFAKHTNLCGRENWGDQGDINRGCSDPGLYQANIAEEEILLSKYEREEQQQLFSAFGSLDDLYYDIVTPPFQSCNEEIPKPETIQYENSEVIEPTKENPITFPSASLEILKNYRSRYRWLNGEKKNVPNYDIACNEVFGRRLSTDAIIRLAGEKFIRSCSQSIDKLSMLCHPYASSYLVLSDDEAKDVELVVCLLASAEKVGQQQFSRASNLLNQCDDLSSNKGNPVQRLVYYFSEALREKIDRETGKVTSKGLGKRQSLDLQDTMMSPNPTVISVYQFIPFPQVSQFTGVQAVIDSVVQAKRVHIIDLNIMGGMQCMILMQSLVGRCECPVEHLKITAVGTRSKQKIEETGKRLISFAQSMNLTFSFNVVIVEDMLDLNEDLFELDAEEAVAVYSPYLLCSMIKRPDRLECLMRVIRNINPGIMVVTEVEANLNSPVFVNRFINSLFFYGAYFDSLEDCMCNEGQNRMIAESIFFSQTIRNIVAAEGEEREIRHVNINIWREFFARFEMVETDLSMLSLYQANMMLKNFSCDSSCTLEIDGKSLVIGWKGTPIHCLSTWKFL